MEAAAAVPGLGMILCTREYAKSRRASSQMVLRYRFYERGLERLRQDWSSMERTGQEFARAEHLYQFDLQILGERSLFSLLCTTRSEAGAERLADYLLDPVDLDEAKTRQEAVQELRPCTQLRESIALLGKYQFQGCDAAALREWMSAPMLRAHPAVPVLLALSGSAVLLLAILCLIQILSWIPVLPILIPLLVVQIAICVPLFRGVRARLRMLRSVSRELRLLREGLALVESRTFASAKLRGLVDRAQASDGARHVRQLERLTWAVDQREKEFLAMPGLLGAAGTQLVLAAERWRRAHREQLGDWIDIWADFDALNAIGGYAWEHPDYVFPEFEEGEASLGLYGLGHPLLPADNCVLNDVVMDRSRRFWILSGSNMAGKSTFLRAVGMNTVLAYAGAPIRAEKARLAIFAVCASVGILDSLLDGKSKFLAEAERLHQILETTKGQAPVLFLIDEILGGTNSHDRRMVCESVVRALTGADAAGIVSTHDLALTSIADEHRLKGLNCCMESEDPGEPLRFDYRVKPGITRHSSALAIIRLLGMQAGSGTAGARSKAWEGCQPGSLQHTGVPRSAGTAEWSSPARRRQKPRAFRPRTDGCPEAVFSRGRPLSPEARGQPIHFTARCAARWSLSILARWNILFAAFADCFTPRPSRYATPRQKYASSRPDSNMLLDFVARRMQRTASAGSARTPFPQ
ncbi:MAG TPA: hypothetical protein VME18_09310 [Acidobacteriaceae bacterium]|nr:hypothetical protein [Acidobacteriaceae bacterium]